MTATKLNVEDAILPMFNTTATAIKEQLNMEFIYPGDLFYASEGRVAMYINENSMTVGRIEESPAYTDSPNKHKQIDYYLEGVLLYSVVYDATHWDSSGEPTRWNPFGRIVQQFPEHPANRLYLAPSDV